MHETSPKWLHAMWCLWPKARALFTDRFGADHKDKVQGVRHKHFVPCHAARCMRRFMQRPAGLALHLPAIFDIENCHVRLEAFAFDCVLGCVF